MSSFSLLLTHFRSAYQATDVAPEMQRSRVLGDETQGINRIEKGEWLILLGMIGAKGECHVFAG
jgi:hypothetical protein